MKTDFKNKVILVKGEAGALSAGIVQSFLNEEAIVVFPAKSLHQIDTMKSFHNTGENKNFITLLIDVNDFDKVIETCETITDRFGKIDIAIQIPDFSNFRQTLTEASMDEWNAMTETDMLPFFMGARIVLNLMKGKMSGMFVHVSDSRFFENLTSCTLARLAFTTRLEMSRIFAEEAYRSGIRYYHLWGQNSPGKEPSKLQDDLPQVRAEMISREIMNLYRQERYTTEMALQSFPKQLLHQPV